MRSPSATFWDLPIELQTMTLSYIPLMHCMNLLSVSKFDYLMSIRLQTDDISLVSSAYYFHSGSICSLSEGFDYPTINEIIYPSAEFETFSSFMQKHEFSKRLKVIKFGEPHSTDIHEEAERLLEKQVELIGVLAKTVQTWKPNFEFFAMKVPGTYIAIPFKEIGPLIVRERDEGKFDALIRSHAMNGNALEFTDTVFACIINERNSAQIAYECWKSYYHSVFQKDELFMQNHVDELSFDIFAWDRNSAAFDFICRFKNLTRLTITTGSDSLADRLNNIIPQLEKLKRLELSKMNLLSLQVSSDSIKELIISHSWVGGIWDCSFLPHLSCLTLERLLNICVLLGIGPEVTQLNFPSILGILPVILEYCPMLPNVKSVRFPSSTLSSLPQKFNHLYPNVIHMRLDNITLTRPNGVKYSAFDFELDDIITSTLKSLTLSRMLPGNLDFSRASSSLRKLELYQSNILWDKCILPTSVKEFYLYFCDISNSTRTDVLQIPWHIQHLKLTSSDCDGSLSFEKGSLIQTVFLNDTTVKDISGVFGNANYIEVFRDFNRMGNPYFYNCYDGRSPIYDKYGVSKNADTYKTFNTQEALDFILEKVYGVSNRSRLLSYSFGFSEERLKRTLNKFSELPQELAVTIGRKNQNM